MNYTDFLDPDELKALASSMNSRARAVNAKGTVTLTILRDRIYESGGKCEWCNVSLVGQAFEVDHILPLNRAGNNTADNLAIACPTCNRSKSDFHPPRFAQQVYARTGMMTPLLAQVFQDYKIEAKTQKSLFGTKEDESVTITGEEDIPDEAPPYIWGNKI